MTIFVVSFRISDETSSYGSRQERWQSVNDTIRSKAIGRNYWKETTSFFTIEGSEDSSKSLADAINWNSKLDPSKDLLLVINLDFKDYTLIGPNNDKDIETIMALRRG